MSSVLLAAANTNYSLEQLLALPLPGLTVALAGVGAGNVENGVHLYAVTFVTALGESLPSAYVSVTVADKTVDGKVAISGVPIGPAGTTARKIYRSKAGLTALLLQQTIANNTGTTGVADNTADASLTTAAPTQDTSGFDKPFGYFAQLIVEADKDNGDDVLMGDSSTLSASNYSSRLVPSASVNFGGNDVPVISNQVWFRSATAGQILHVHGREL